VAPYADKKCLSCSDIKTVFNNHENTKRVCYSTQMWSLVLNCTVNVVGISYK